MFNINQIPYKTKILSVVFLFLSSLAFGQTKMKLYFNNGDIKEGAYEIKLSSIIYSKPKKNKGKKIKKERYYVRRDIRKFDIYKCGDTIHYRHIDTKKYATSKEIKKKLAQLIYSGNKLEIYYVGEGLYQAGTFGSYYEKYVKKKGEKIAYNMGYIYGAGQRGIKKRVRDYFTDCPDLINIVNENKIKKNDLLEIVKFYEGNCN